MKITKKKMMVKMKMKTNCKRDRSGRLISPTSGPDLLPPVITLLHLILLYFKYNIHTFTFNKYDICTFYTLSHRLKTGFSARNNSIALQSILYTFTRYFGYKYFIRCSLRFFNILCNTVCIVCINIQSGQRGTIS